GFLIGGSHSGAVNNRSGFEATGGYNSSFNGSQNPVKGNFALALAAGGYRVEAIDAYGEYGDALAPCVALQRGSGVVVHDFATAGPDLSSLHGRFDAVVCAGVIEHIPHTPRLLLETLTRLLAPGGVLVLDTPNLAYLYRRLALLEGQTIFPPIAQQYYTELPFEGHHREYTVAEVEWMLGAAGHEVLSIETFNYSVFGQTQLVGDHVDYYHAMQADPSLREIIFAVSRRPADV
ncbi:MAG: class I SAM-dependent methyltransferase, partial [Vicinamibacteria bacterium]